MFAGFTYFFKCLDIAGIIEEVQGLLNFFEFSYFKILIRRIEPFFNPAAGGNTAFWMQTTSKTKTNNNKDDFSNELS